MADEALGGLSEAELFDDAEVNTLMVDSIVATIGDAPFNAAKISTWTTNIVDACLKKLAALGRYLTSLVSESSHSVGVVGKCCLQSRPLLGTDNVQLRIFPKILAHFQQACLTYAQAFQVRDHLQPHSKGWSRLARVILFALEFKDRRQDGCALGKPDTDCPCHRLLGCCLRAKCQILLERTSRRKVA